MTPKQIEIIKKARVECISGKSATAAATLYALLLDEEKQEQGKPLCTAAMFDDAFLAKSGLSPDTKLYTTPQQRKPLTYEQIVDINNKYYSLAYRDFDADIAIAREIEAAHGIKENT